MKRLYVLIVPLVLCCFSSYAVEKSHGLALYGPQDLKYNVGEPYSWANLDAPSGGTLNLSNFGSFTKLNPLSLKGSSAPLIGYCFETLGQSSADPREPFSVYGRISEAFSLSDDSLSLTCYLNKAAHFSDGTPLTADDVIFSYNLIFDAEYQPQYKAIFSDIKEARKIDQHTVRFTFKELNKELPLVLATNLSILPKHVYGVEGKSFGKDFDDMLPIGSGPYVVTAFDKSSYIKYKLDPNWWGKNLPLNRGRFNFETVNVTVFLDRNPEIQALKSGLVDAKGIYSSKYWHLEFNGDYFKKNYSVRKLFVPEETVVNMQGFAMNLRRKKFQDIRIRKALASVFDFEHMNKNLFYGQYQRCISYWNSSKEMSTRGPATGKERDILIDLAQRFNKPAEGKIVVPKEAITRGPYVVGAAPDGSMYDISDRIIAANRYLDSIGWIYNQEAQARQKDGETLSVEFMLYGSGFQRICNPYIELLKEIGIKARIQIVQPAEYVKRIKNFDYDFVTWQYGGNSSPGNELKDWFHTEAADTAGSSNVIGIRNPAIDEVIGKIIKADSRKELVLYTKVLDRILCANHYMIPQWNIATTRAVYWNRISGPKLFTGMRFRDEVLNFWWYDEEKANALKAAMDNDIALKNGSGDK